MASKFTELAIDCSDPERLARFWADVLGYRITEREQDLVFIEGGEGAGPGLTFVRVPEAKAVKNRIHIDVNPTDREQEEEVTRIIGLGARRIDIGQGEVSWVVLADPEGNEFCVLHTRVD
jgi:catechol 2,3-dioxygenase-like lactoylglutathione lyase family enzyme